MYEVGGCWCSTDLVNRLVTRLYTNYSNAVAVPECEYGVNIDLLVASSSGRVSGGLADSRLLRRLRRVVVGPSKSSA